MIYATARPLLRIWVRKVGAGAGRRCQHPIQGRCTGPLRPHSLPDRTGTSQQRSEAGASRRVGERAGLDQRVSDSVAAVRSSVARMSGPLCPTRKNTLAGLVKIRGDAPRRATTRKSAMRAFRCRDSSRREWCEHPGSIGPPRRRPATGSSVARDGQPPGSSLRGSCRGTSASPPTHPTA